MAALPPLSTRAWHLVYIQLVGATFDRAKFAQIKRIVLRFLVGDLNLDSHSNPLSVPWFYMERTPNISLVDGLDHPDPDSILNLEAADVQFGLHVDYVSCSDQHGIFPGESRCSCRDLNIIKIFQIFQDF